MSKKKYFSLANLEEALVEDIREYPLPDDPEITVRLKSVSSARMRQYGEAAAKGGAIERRAQAHLIVDSVIDENGNPAFKSIDEVYNLASKIRSRRLNGVIKIISQHNGGEDKVSEDDEKKFDSGSSNSTSA